LTGIAPPGPVSPAAIKRFVSPGLEMPKSSGTGEAEVPAEVAAFLRLSILPRRLPIDAGWSIGLD
jgi:hypothetical protein